MRIRVGVDTEVVGRRVHRDARRDRGPGPERDVSEEQSPHGDVVVSFEVDPHLPGGKDREVVDPDILAEAYPSRAVEPSVATDTGRSADRRETKSTTSASLRKLEPVFILGTLAVVLHRDSTHETSLLTPWVPRPTMSPPSRQGRI